RRTGTPITTATRQPISRRSWSGCGVASSSCPSSSTGRRARSRSTYTAGAPSRVTKCAGAREAWGLAPGTRSIMTRVSGYTIVVPAFNEESGLPTVLAEPGRLRPDAEIVVVDDGSTDGTGRVAREFPVTVISHPSNRGYGAALKTGIVHAKHDLIVFFDADGQHDPAHIRPMLDALATADLVIGERKTYTRRSALHWLGRRFLTRFIHFLTRPDLPHTNSWPRAAPRDPV